MTRLYRLLCIPLALTLLLTSLTPVALASLSKPERLKIMMSVVQIWWIWQEPKGLRGSGMGSGTLISADGLILTNYHVAFPEEKLGVTHLGIALTTRSDQPPQPAYLAKVVAADRNLDLAVLRITHDPDLRPVRAADLQLPFIPLGDSDKLDMGDELDIFGYPGIGGETVTFTRGVVSGFTREAAVSGRAWIKTDTTIAGGNSGGTAVNEEGALVGVPTRAGAGGDTATVDCRPLADTNRDGTIDSRDTCVPVGGFLNALRPINLAKPLIEAARQGVTNRGAGSQPSKAAAPASQSRFANFLFSPGVTDDDEPTTLITGLPSGATSLYVFFDYENMVDGAPWEMRVQINGKRAPDWDLPAGEWSGGAAGTWWTGWSDVEFVDGVYQMQFLVDGRQVAETQIQVGGRTQPQTAAFKNLVFSQDVSAQGDPVKPGRLFPEGITRLYAVVDYEGMTSGMAWTRTWLLDNEVAATTTAAWGEGAKGRTKLELTSDSGLPAGNWRLELSIQGKLAARADFTVAGQQGGALFEPFVFSHEVDQETGKPLSTNTRFPTGVKAVYVFSNYQGMKDGLRCISRIYLDGKLMIESPFEWSNEFYGGATGVWWNAIHANGDQLPQGEYTQELLVEGQLVQRGSVIVGSGAQPTPTPAPAAAANAVQVGSVVTDADTGRPIAGAFFIVLKPGIAVKTFQWKEAEVYTLAEADRQGVLTLPLGLERGKCYSLIIGADGYWPHTEDDVCVGPNTPADTRLAIQLQKR